MCLLHVVNCIDTLDTLSIPRFHIYLRDAVDCHSVRQQLCKRFRFRMVYGRKEKNGHCIRLSGLAGAEIGERNVGTVFAP